MNGKEYPIQVLFKNPNLARDVYKRYQTSYRAMGVTLDGQVRLGGPRLYVCSGAGRFLNDFIEEASAKHPNPRYKIEKGREHLHST
ncbi:hypothetical protein HYU09_04495 [Candidatus Woesearchaeota archaeon]|nr:hypothetical protein [Candidatus Woesearchaeota archaeon]